METASAIQTVVAPLRRRPSQGLGLRRYTISLTERQEREILSECTRRGELFNVIVRRVIDAWVETRITKREGGQ